MNRIMALSFSHIHLPPKIGVSYLHIFEEGVFCRNMIKRESILFSHIYQDYFLNIYIIINLSSLNFFRQLLEVPLRHGTSFLFHPPLLIWAHLHRLLSV
ncbi:hypothetical protein COJ55_01035 [Bacillus cereus]|nr:hypothetical protein COJ55_01035 [Bacillus cereus]